MFIVQEMLHVCTYKYFGCVILRLINWLWYSIAIDYTMVHCSIAQQEKNLDRQTWVASIHSNSNYDACSYIFNNVAIFVLFHLYVYAQLMIAM